MSTRPSNPSFITLTRQRENQAPSGLADRMFLVETPVARYHETGMLNLVVGATGNLGMDVAQRLLQRGESVRTLVRDLGSPAAEELRQAGAELCRGDLAQPETLAAACRGVGRVLASATAATTSDDALIQKVDGEGYQALIREAAAASVGRFVFVSAHGFESDSPVLLARAKAASEKALQESGLDYVILRPTLFMESWIGLIVGMQLQAGDTLHVIGSPDQPYGFVSASNVADLVLAVSFAPRPESVVTLSAGVASYRQIVEWVETIQRRKIQIQSHPVPSQLPGIPPIVNQLWNLVASDDTMDLETPDTAEAYGIQAISPQVFVQKAFGPGR